MARDQPHHTPATERAPAEGSKSGNSQAAPPPPKKKGGEGGTTRKQPIATKPPAKNTKGGQTPHPEGTEDRTPKEAQGDHPVKTGNTKPGTAAHREKGHQNKQTHRKKKNKPAAQLERKGMGGETTRPGTGTPSNREKKKAKKHTPTTQPRRARHSRDPGPARTCTPHTGTGNGQGQAKRARNHTRPKSRPTPKPNHEHHKQPAKEGQHHKRSPNKPTQDPSHDWQGLTKPTPNRNPDPTTNASQQ